MATVVETYEHEGEAEPLAKANATKMAKRKPKKKTLGQKIAKQVMMMVRRIHLFSGLFMFPWVLLYGFTGWFFNHPTYFSSDQVRAFQSTDLEEGSLAILPEPGILANKVAEELNLESSQVDGPSIVLTNKRQPHFDRYLSYSVSTDGESHRVEIDPITGDGIVRTTLVEKKDPSDTEESEGEIPRNPLEEVTNIELEENNYTIARDAIPGLLSNLGLASGEPSSGRSSPNLVFSAEVDGIPCKVVYNLRSGEIAALADAAPRSEMSAKSFSQRLHLSRGYTPSMGTRTWWAISVDAMFFSMVFWGISGIFMWWQIKRTRMIGFVILGASAICAAWLVLGMHEELSSRIRSRGRSSVATKTASEDSKNGATKEAPGLGKTKVEEAIPRDSDVKLPSAKVSGSVP